MGTFLKHPIFIHLRIWKSENIGSLCTVCFVLSLLLKGGGVHFGNLIFDRCWKRRAPTNDEDPRNVFTKSWRRDQYLPTNMKSKSLIFQLKRHGPTARVPHVRSCPPRRWSGAGVGVGMLRDAGDCLTWKQQSFLSSWYQGFLVSWFQGFLVSWLQRFKKSFKVFGRYLVHLTKSPFHVFWWILISYS